MVLDWLEKLLDGCFALIPRCKPQAEAVPQARLIAHRGVHHNERGIIENTLVAFRLAQTTGCWGIELDVRATADRVLVVNHDATLTRLWGHERTLADMTFSELRELVPGIPSLAEVVAEFGQKMHLFIELKTPFQDENVLVETLQGLSAGEDYHLLTLTAPIFESLSQVPKHALLLVASFNNVREFCELSVQKHYGGVLGHYLLLTRARVKQLKDAGQHVGVGFVDSKYSVYRELNRDVFWLFSNRVTEVSASLQSLSK